MKSSGPDRFVAAPAPEQRRVPPEPASEQDATSAAPAQDATSAAPAQDAASAAPARGVADAGAPSAVPAAVDGPALTEREREILAFERQWWKHAGAKEQAIRDAFDLSATRYYQLLNALLDNPAALEHDPVLVGRLRRLRSTRTRSRSTRPT